MITSAVILAAGMGSRLTEVLNDRPKGFLKIGGIELIERSVELLLKRGVTSIVIVTGHLADHYQVFAKKHPQITLVNNPVYADSGSMYSLYCARDLLRFPFFLLESDLIYEMRALGSLQAKGDDTAVLMSGLSNAGDEVYICAPDGTLQNMSKDRDELAHISGELVGICTIGQTLFEQMVTVSEAFFKKTLHMDYEYCLVECSKATEIPMVLVSDLLWSEIDEPAHYERVLNSILPQIEEKEKMVTRNILLNPGPATTTQSVKNAMVVADVCPREHEFGNLMSHVCDRLVEVVNGADSYVAVSFGGSGTLGLEACISSVAPDGKKVLIIDNGAYGARMVQIAQIHGLDVLVHQKPWGESPDLDSVELLLKEHEGQISHVAIVHHETTTGMLNPVDDCVRLAHKYGAQAIVDAMSSYGGIEIDAQTMEFDYLISSSNKCIQGMPGITFVICRKTCMENSSKVPMRSLYMNLYQQYEYFVKNHQSAFTPPVQVFYALDQALSEFFEETGAGRFARYAKSFETLMRGITTLGFHTLLPDDKQSGILLAIEEPSNPTYSFDDLHDHMKTLGFIIYPGKGGALPTFRLSVLGAISYTDIQDFLDELKSYLASRKLLGNLYV